MTFCHAIVSGKLLFLLDSQLLSLWIPSSNYSIWSFMTPVIWANDFVLSFSYMIHMRGSLESRILHSAVHSGQIYYWEDKNINQSIFNIIRWVDGPNDSSTKRLMFQVLYWRLTDYWTNEFKEETQYSIEIEILFIIYYFFVFLGRNAVSSWSSYITNQIISQHGQ